jgi:hypothetical protein
MFHNLENPPDNHEPDHHPHELPESSREDVDAGSIAELSTGAATATLEYEEPLSFARTQIEAHGVAVGDRPVVASQNFVVDASAAQPLSDPKGDVYLNFLGIGASAPGDIVLTLRTLPGLLDAYHQLGLLSPSTRVFEVNPVLDENVTGYPNTSPLAQLSSNPSLGREFQDLFEGKEAPIFVGTFLTDSMRNEISELGCDVVQTTNPALTNHKLSFGRASEEYGFDVMPQVAIENQMSFAEAALLALRALQERRRNEGPLSGPMTLAWLKLAGGSGGDFVQKIEISCDDALSSDPIIPIKTAVDAAYHRLRASVKLAFERNQYGEGALERFWPHDSVCPAESAVLVEQDARARGSIHVNASNLMIINDDGSHSVEGYFCQITGADGDYRGSMPWSPEADLPENILEQLEQSMRGIARYAFDRRLRGYIGVDFFVTKNPCGQFELVMTEMNGRIPISGAAKIIADKLKAPAWINVNLELPEPIYSYEDFTRQLGSLANGTGSGSDRCQVIPQAFRTMYDGEQYQASRQLKALIVGPSQQACLATLEHLTAGK